MSIFRNTFTDSIKSQLGKRQDAMTNRTAANIQYLNSRNAWIRMVSSVDVNGKSDLAKQYILQGGTLNDGTTKKEGVGSTFDKAYSNTSALGLDYRLGIRPMPGITNMDIKSRSAYGSLREVTINFQCWDIKQLEDLEVLYMRPGYTVLVEWGWSPYLDNSGKLQTNPITPYPDILNNTQNKTRTEIFADLYKKSNDSGGNYDAMFGYVKNYSWSARPDGGYDCQTTLISTGEIIESLKVNYIRPDTATIGNSNPVNPGLLTDEFINVNNSLDDPQKIFYTGLSNYYQKNVLAGIWAETYFKLKDPTFSTPSTSNYYQKNKFIKLPVEFNTPDSIQPGSPYQVYITLEAFFDILNKYVIPSQLVKLSLKSSTKTSDGSDLLCLAHPLQISVDPTICLIKNKLWYEQGIQGGILYTNQPQANVSKISHDINEGSLGYSGNLGGNYTVKQKQDYFDRFINALNQIKDLNTFATVANNLVNTNKGIANIINDNFKDEVVYRSPAFGGTASKTEFLIALETLKTNTNGAFNFTIKAEIKGPGVPNLSSLPDETYFLDKVFIDDKILNPTISTISSKSQAALTNLQFLKDLDQEYFLNGDPYSEIGIIKNIYVNVDFLYRTALDPNIEGGDRKDKNEINLFTYIKNIIVKIQAAIGNLNTFEVHVDPIDNDVARIIDINYVNKDKISYDKLFQLEVHNLKSVVRSYTLQSQIFPDQSAVIAIGAQAKGGQMGIQNNTMIDFNRNLTDRVLPAKEMPYPVPIDVNQQKSTAVAGNLAAIINKFSAFTLDKPTDSSPHSVDAKSLQSDVKNNLRDLIVYFQSITKSSSSGKNIIPVKFSFEMDGIGGLVIGHLFRIPEDILPKGYKGRVNGIGSQLAQTVTGIGHTISNGDWVTKIDALNFVLSSFEDSKKIPFKELDLKDIIKQSLAAFNAPTTQPQDGQTPPIFQYGQCFDITNRKSYPADKYPLKLTEFSRVNKQDIINYINSSKYPIAVKRGFYASFMIETSKSDDGKFVNSINNNINGMQTDGGLWAYADQYIKGTTEFPEGRTKSCRAFAVYNTWQSCVDHVLKIFNDRIQGSNREIIPKNVDDANFFATGYAKNWIGAEPKDADYAKTITTLISLYKGSKTIIK